MKRLNTKGFSAIEGLLVLIIVGMLGFVGWYVWHSKQNTNNIYNTAANVQTPVADTAPASTKTTSTTDSNKFFTIKTWGVKIPISAIPAGLSYTVQKSYLYIFTSTKLDAIGCSAKAKFGIYLNRGKATDQFTLENGDTTTVKQAYDDTAAPQVKVKVGDYYYFENSSETCSMSLTGTTSSKDTVARTEIRTAIKSLVAL